MTPQTVLDTLTGTGIRIELENGNLRYHSHKLLDDELINLIRTHKTGQDLPVFATVVILGRR